MDLGCSDLSDLDRLSRHDEEFVLTSLSRGLLSVDESGGSQFAYEARVIRPLDVFRQHNDVR